MEFLVLMLLPWVISLFLRSLSMVKFMYFKTLIPIDEFHLVLRIVRAIYMYDCANRLLTDIMK
jgi:hypothetical protein